MGASGNMIWEEKREHRNSSEGPVNLLFAPTQPPVVHRARLLGWCPIKPRGEVYSRELTEAGYKSFSDVQAELEREATIQREMILNSRRAFQ